MIDEKKSKERIERARAAEKAATKRDMAAIWQPLTDAVLAQGATELRDYHGEGLVHPPFGWRSPDPAALGPVLETALLAQISQLAGPEMEEPKGGGEKSWDRRFELSGERRRALGLAAWGLRFVGECWGFDQALGAYGRACREIAAVANPGPLREAMLKLALDGGYRSTPDDACARLNALARDPDIWRLDTAWGAKVAAEKTLMFDAMMDRFDVGHWGASLVKAGTERHDCARSVADLIEKFVGESSGGEVDWSSKGSQVGKQMGYLFVRADKLPESYFEDLPMEFWLGAKTEMGPASKVGAAILQRLLDRAKNDKAIKSRLCAVVWLGLDRKEIDAFDARFPGEAGPLLKKGVEVEFSGMVGRVSVAYRVATTLGRPSGAWARKAFSAHGLDAENVADKLYREEGGGEKLAASMMAAYALREAAQIKASVKLAAAEREAAGGPKASSVKKAKAKRI